MTGPHVPQVDVLAMTREVDPHPLLAGAGHRPYQSGRGGPEEAELRTLTTREFVVSR